MLCAILNLRIQESINAQESTNNATMRGLFYALLLANLGIASWIAWQHYHQPPEAIVLKTDRGVPLLVLLSEQEDVLAAVRLPDDTNVSRQNLDPITDALLCYSLGPVPSRADVRQVMAALDGHVVRSRQKEGAAEQEIGHWVYLRAVKSREQALSIARELANQGMRDYYVVTAGDQENTVSLGLFREYSNALRRQRVIKSLGFDAQLSVRTERLPVYWIEYVIQAGTPLPWEEVIASIDGAERQVIPCF